MRAQAYPKMLDQAVDQIREVLERRRNVPFGGKDNFQLPLRATSRGISQYRWQSGAGDSGAEFYRPAGGGIGVMNIMLVSVTEADARNWNPQSNWRQEWRHYWQFLLEAMTLTGAEVSLRSYGQCSRFADPCDPPVAWIGSGMGGWDWGRRQRQYWIDLRGVAGDESGEARSRRSPALRITRSILFFFLNL